LTHKIRRNQLFNLIEVLRRLSMHLRASIAYWCLVVILCGHFALPAEGQIRRIAELSVTDIQAMDHSQTIVIIPAGLFEEHGPYLPSFSDGYENEWLSLHVAEALVTKTSRPILLFPTIPLGVGSPEDFGARQPFSGSYTVRPATLRTIFMDLGDALGRDGFRWIFILDSHGSPSHNRSLLEAGNYFHDTYGGRMVPLTAYQDSMVGDPPPFWQGAEAAENGFDIHGGAEETSELLFVRPEFVHDEYRTAKPQTAATDADFSRLAAASDWPGYFGSPRLASAQAGALLMQRRADNMTDLALRILDGFDPMGVPTRATPINKGFATLDENLLRRSEIVAVRQREWLAKNGLQ
jgi:creatinine amidohydrolase